MKKLVIIFTTLMLFTQPLYGLAPQEPDWGSITVAAVAPVLAQLKNEKSPERRSTIQKEAEGILSRVENTQRVVPYWNTLVFNSDGSFEIVVDYVDKKGKSNIVINRFVLAKGGEYSVQVIKEESLVNNRIARVMLGLNLSSVEVPAGILKEVKNTGLPQALAFVEKGLLEESPEAFAYRNAVTEESPVQKVLGVIAEVKGRISPNLIRAVVVLGIGGQSLGNRAVVQMLGSEEVKFIFPDNITNPNRWLAELEGINPNEVLLYVSSKTGSTDETMANFWFFWEWLIQKIGPQEVAGSLLVKLQGVNLATTDLLNELDFTVAERGLLQNTLNRIVVSTTLEKNGPIYSFAIKNNIPIVPLQAPVEERYTVLFRSGQFTTALAGYDIERMRQAVAPLANAFKGDNSELNPALDTAVYAYALNRPVLAMVTSNKRLTPLFEWARQLVNESLGKEGKGPYLTFATGKEASQELMSAPKNKLFLAINVGEEKIQILEGVSVIEINIPEINQETLARIFLFLEEFTVRYGTLLGVNPVTQPWVDKFKEILTETAERLDTTPAGRQTRQAEANAVKETSISGGVETPELLEKILIDITRTDQELTIPLQTPKGESEFHGVLDLGKNKLPEETERQARNLAKQLYTVGKLGISLNPFFIYSANPEVRLLGEFIRYLGQKRMARLARFGGGILWDYLIGTTDQHSAAQFLGAGNDIAVTTFIHFLQEPSENPPIIRANGLIQKRLDGKTPEEVNTLYLESVRQALNNEGRLTNTINVPNEREENLRELYQLSARASELYSRLIEYEGKGGLTVGGLIRGNETVVIRQKGSVEVGGKEATERPIDLGSVVTPMLVGGVNEKKFINPQPGQMSGVVSGILNKFMNRVSALARMVSIYARKNDSFLNRLANTEELKEKAKPEFYVLKLEDTIAKVEIGSEVGDTLWEEIRIKAANTMIAKTVQEIKRINPEARVVVYTEDKNMTERRIKAALDAVDSAGVFDMIVCGNIRQVLAEISKRGWAKSVDEAMQRTIFASVNKIEREGENVRSVIVPNERFIPFPELITVMHAMLNIDETQGLPIDRIVESYRVWLELAGFDKDEIESYIGYLRNALSTSTNYVVTLPIPPVPKAGSVMGQLDKEYSESADINGNA